MDLIPPAQCGRPGLAHGGINNVRYQALDQLEPLTEFGITIGGISLALTVMALSVRGNDPIATPEWRTWRAEFIAAQASRLETLAAGGIDVQARCALQLPAGAWIVGALLEARDARRFARLIADPAWDQVATEVEYNEILGTLGRLHDKFTEVRNQNCYAGIVGSRWPSKVASSP